MDRRQFFAAGAAGASVLACWGGVWHVTRKPETATKPWATAGQSSGEIRLDSFRWAILAPNPHNRQPWLIRLVDDKSALLYCDLNKRLPQTDPFDRQTVIGFGTFIELARIAAAELGYRMAMTPFPEGEPQLRLDERPVARLEFFADAAVEKDPLFPMIARRRSNKAVYDTSRPVPPNVLYAVRTPDGASNDPSLLRQIREIAVASMLLEMDLERTHRESVDLMRIGRAAIDQNPDGIAIQGPMAEMLATAGLLDKAALADPASSAFQSGKAIMIESHNSASAILWIKTPGNSRADQLEAGRRYVRANLEATARGIAMHPMSQSLQEYPEMAAQYRVIHDTLGAAAGERIQMLARIGYAEPSGPAPRWPLTKHIIA
ncbi:Acg family FMN-binding oxidoreductase [Sphingorhabdus pulchriflava]|uniref:Acg family FMN-binding oxidoreductase n=1 Tax=Sphingorhabdus pulchriflava TaxID=2292257 RepID=UPI0015F19D2A|nr:twin-arginine translocation pathway signal protein [Sphingorhabdus pulchriflava]